MKLLAVTNLYPPQELGGYGRSIADFVWGLQQRGHTLHVLSSDAPYLGPGTATGPSGEPVHRQLHLLGTYEGGVKPLLDRQRCEEITAANQRAIADLWRTQGPFDGALVGNLDLLGLDLLGALLRDSRRVIHHIGFVNPPFPPEHLPRSPAYQLVGASAAVSTSLQQAGLHRQGGPIPVVYPGVRCDLFGLNATGRPLPPPLDGSGVPQRLGTASHPLRVCFAGLLMGSKGAHTLVDALVQLKQSGVVVQGHIAGGAFQQGYKEHLQRALRENGLDEDVRFVGQLQRSGLARFFRLHHVCVFPSIHPEAFGIVGAEAMASGLALVSSGVGGACELFEDQISGLRFQPGEANDLATKLHSLCATPGLLTQLARHGERRARLQLSVETSAQHLEALFEG